MVRQAAEACADRGATQNKKIPAGTQAPLAKARSRGAAAALGALQGRVSAPIAAGRENSRDRPTNAARKRAGVPRGVGGLSQLCSRRPRKAARWSRRREEGCASALVVKARPRQPPPLAPGAGWLGVGAVVFRRTLTHSIKRQASASTRTRSVRCVAGTGAERPCARRAARAPGAATHLALYRPHVGACAVGATRENLAPWPANSQLRRRARQTAPPRPLWLDRALRRRSVHGPRSGTLGLLRSIKTDSFCCPTRACWSRGTRPA
jgi:hypothetical protein